MFFLESEHLIQAAEAKAAQIILDAESVYEQERQRGYEDGQLSAKKSVQKLSLILLLNVITTIFHRKRE